MKKQHTVPEAKHQIANYFAQAAREDHATSARLVAKARTLAMKHRLKLPKELKRQYCNHCYAHFVPGKTYRVRTHEGMVVYTCFTCGACTRFSYKKQQQKKRKEKATKSSLLIRTQA